MKSQNNGQLEIDKVYLSIQEDVAPEDFPDELSSEDLRALDLVREFESGVLK